MNRLPLMKIVMLLLLSLCQYQSISAAELGPNCDVVVKERTFEVSDQTNAIVYKVDVKSGGEYYCMLSLSNPENLYDTKIYVNDRFVADLSQKKSDGMYLVIDDKFRLSDGVNDLRFVTTNPNVASVGAVSISSSLANLQKIKSNQNMKYSERQAVYDEDDDNDAVDPTSLEVGESTTLNIPLSYTYWEYKYFKKGEDHTFRCTSSFNHAMDLFIVGTDAFPILQPIPNSQYQQDSNIIEDGTPDLGSNKIYYPVSQPNNWERTGINWHSDSKFLLGSYSTIIKAKIPISGLYMIRLRKVGRSLGPTGSLTLDGEVIGSNLSIGGSFCEFEIPADGCRYSVRVSAISEDTDDPMLFIENCRAGRIGAYNDDHSGTVLPTYPRTSPGIITSFLMPTKSIHVNQYYSTASASSCVVEIKKMSNPSTSQQRVSNRTTGIEMTETEGEFAVTPAIADLGESIVIRNGQPGLIKVYSLDGTVMSSFEIGDESVCKTPAEMGIRAGGMYIIQYSGADQSQSVQLLVR